MNAKSVSLEKVSGRESEYILKDSSGITSGRVFIVEMSQENKYCTIRIKYYRNNNSDMLREATNLILKNFFKSNDINKINIFVDEQNDIQAFIDLGFKLEGIVENNIFSNGSYRNELLFGITYMEYKNNLRNNTLCIEGKSIELRVLSPEHAEEMYRYNIKNRTFLSSYEPSRDENFYTVETQRKILVEEYKQFLNGNTLNCGIFKNNYLIGKIRLSNIVYGVFRSAFLGYSIDEEEQNNGYMKEAVKLITDYAFDEMELHRIEASTLVDNIKSQKVLLKCEFEQVGINKKYLFINGEWRDHITFYKIK
jgi:Acetyltransferases, including N-acetylases of ribosomal proteins